MKTFKQWLDLAKATVRTTEQNHVAIAELCYYDDRNGGYPSTWHSSAIVHGHSCNCAACGNRVWG